LFADVELRKGDDAQRLAKLGLSLVKKRPPAGFRAAVRLFRWHALPDLHRRPKRCRTFECGLLKRVQAGELDADAALKTITQDQTSG